MSLGEAIVKEARSWLGTPFVHCAQTKGVGCDCVGLWCGIAREIGLFEYRPSNYSRQVDPARLLGEVLRFFDPVGGSPEPGDLLLINVKGSAQHVGVFCEGSYIHAFEPAGKVAENSFQGLVLGAIEGVFRVKKALEERWQRSF